MSITSSRAVNFRQTPLGLRTLLHPIGRNDRPNRRRAPHNAPMTAPIVSASRPKFPPQNMPLRKSPIGQAVDRNACGMASGLTEWAWGPELGVQVFPGIFDAAGRSQICMAFCMAYPSQLSAGMQASAAASTASTSAVYHGHCHTGSHRLGSPNAILVMADLGIDGCHPGSSRRVTGAQDAHRGNPHGRAIVVIHHVVTPGKRRHHAAPDVGHRAVKGRPPRSNMPSSSKI